MSVSSGPTSKKLANCPQTAVDESLWIRLESFHALWEGYRIVLEEVQVESEFKKYKLVSRLAGY